MRHFANAERVQKDSFMEQELNMSKEGSRTFARRRLKDLRANEEICGIREKLRMF